MIESLKLRMRVKDVRKLFDIALEIQSVQRCLNGEAGILDFDSNGDGEGDDFGISALKTTKDEDDGLIEVLSKEGLKSKQMGGEVISMTAKWKKKED
ncbi:hypothetical protein L1887_20646 [Cichorium endivia]|nr:hypothetical protein L1887_20646 [Cichorium endivia]